MSVKTTETATSALDRLLRAVEASSARLLDPVWHGWNAQYRLQCAQGHVWARSASHIVFHGPCECPECVAQQRLAHLAEAVAQTGSVCLDAVWKGIDARYWFRCSAGHMWQRVARNVLWKDATHCPQCMQQIANEKRRVPDGLERLQATAAAKGGQCLTEHYAGVNARYRFRCEQGHEWETAGHEILRGTWCRQCANEGKCSRYLDTQGLVRLRAAAAEHGGVCLSEIYTGQATHYRFRCAHGHEWETTGKKILQGCWCRRCANDVRRTQDIAVFRALAEARGGKCLSEAYRGSKAKLTWSCQRGHVWQAAPEPIKKGHWCPRCAFDAKMDDIAVFRALAEARGGECLSEAYRGCSVKLTLRCHRGHVWSTLPGTIKKGHWCPECAHANKITRGDSKARMRYAKSALHGQNVDR